jgi:hypothetical protein
MKLAAVVLCAFLLIPFVVQAETESVLLICKCDNNSMMMFSDGATYKLFPGELKSPELWPAFTSCTISCRGNASDKNASYVISNGTHNINVVATKME